MKMDTVWPLSLWAELLAQGRRPNFSPGTAFASLCLLLQSDDPRR